jgi:hypothetical protein
MCFSSEKCTSINIGGRNKVYTKNKNNTPNQFPFRSELLSQGARLGWPCSIYSLQEDPSPVPPRGVLNEPEADSDGRVSVSLPSPFLFSLLNSGMSGPNVPSFFSMNLRV